MRIASNAIFPSTSEPSPQILSQLQVNWFLKEKLTTILKEKLTTKGYLLGAGFDALEVFEEASGQVGDELGREAEKRFAPSYIAYGV